MLTGLMWFSVAFANPVVETVAEGAESAAAVVVRERGALRMEDTPEVDERLVRQLQPWQEIRSASLVGFMADSAQGLFVRTRFGSTDQLHHVAGPGGARTQLTFDAEPIAGADPHPRLSNLVVLQRDVGGNEAYQYELLDLLTRDRTLLTDGVSRNEGFSWSPDGMRYAYFSTARNGTDFDLYVGTLGQPASLAVQNEGMWRLTDWAPDGNTVIAYHYESITRSALYELNLTTGDRRRLTPEGEVSVQGGKLSPDGRRVYLTSDHAGEFRSIVELDRESLAMTELAPWIRWDIEQFALSPDGRTLAFVANERGYGRLYTYDARKRRIGDPPAIPEGQVGSIAFAKDRNDLLAFSLYGATAPSDVWTLDTRRNRVSRWTTSEVGGLNPRGFVSPELVTWTTFDGLSLDAFLYTPPGPGPHPVVISIHGGPEGQSRPYLASLYQILVREAGCAVLVPNVRGSSGYGKTFLALDNAEKREDSVKDIGTLIDWIATQPGLDQTRVGVRGGSYGGYMVLASLLHFGDRIRGGVDIVGISDFVTFLENTKSYRRDLRRVEYGDERDPAMRAHLESISPLRQAANITSRLFVIHGANDPRVPVTEAEQIVEAVRGQGRNVWYLRAENEGHGFRKKENREVATALEVQFFQEVLGSSPKE